MNKRFYLLTEIFGQPTKIKKFNRPLCLVQNRQTRVVSSLITVHHFYSLISSFTQFLSIRIVLPYFHLLIFYFEKILNLNLTFAICRIREA